VVDTAQVQLNGSLAGALAADLSDIRFADLSQQTQERARLVLLDTVGAMLAGAAYGRSAHIVRDTMRALGESGPATVVGEGLKMSAPSAALCNGISAHALDLDDSHRFAAGYHPGATVIPAVLAVAEQERAGISAVLEGIVVGYEVGGRIGRAINPSHRYRGFHSTGTVGVLGAAAGAARMLRLGPHETAMALAVAASMAGGVFAFLNGLHPTKHLHAGHAAQAGVLAALLARNGFTGPEDVLEGPEGFFRAYSDEVRPEVVTEGLGARTEILSNYFKPYTACGHGFTAIEAALDLRRRGVEASQIVAVEVATYRAASVLHNAEPQTFQEGQFSIPFLVSLCLHHGVVSIDSVRSGLSDTSVLALAGRTRVTEEPSFTDAFPARRPTEVVVRLADGSSLSAVAESAAGMPERPLTSEQVTRKFTDLASPLLASGAVAEIVETVGSDATSVDGLLRHRVTTHEVIA
jgi:2-methylcitrate dehydratase PrpD